DVRKNTSWGLHQTLAAKVIRSHHPDADLELIRRVIKALEPGPRYPVPRADAVAFYRSFAAENELLRSRYFPHKKELFEEDFSMYPEVFDMEAEIGNLSESDVLQHYRALEMNMRRSS